MPPIRTATLAFTSLIASVCAVYNPQVALSGQNGRSVPTTSTLSDQQKTAPLAVASS